MADAALDALLPIGDLGAAFALAPFLGTVGVADRHSHDRDRRLNLRDRLYTGYSPPGADDYLGADLLAQDAVWRTDVAGLLGRDRRRLQAQAERADGGGGFRHDRVGAGTPVSERQIKALQLQIEADYLGREQPQRLLQQLPPGLVAFEYG